MSDRVGTEDMGNWERTARRFDAAILQEAGAKALTPTLLHRLGGRWAFCAIGFDLSRLAWAKWRAHRDHGTGCKAYRQELRRLAKAVGWYVLACFGFGTMQRVKDYLYAGHPEPPLSCASAH